MAMRTVTLIISLIAAISTAVCLIKRYDSMEVVSNIILLIAIIAFIIIDGKKESLKKKMSNMIEQLTDDEKITGYPEYEPTIRAFRDLDEE